MYTRHAHTIRACARARALHTITCTYSMLDLRALHYQSNPLSVTTAAAAARQPARDALLSRWAESFSG